MDFKEHLLTFMDNKEVDLLLDAMDKEPVHCFKLNVLKNPKLDYLEKLKKHPFVKDAYYYDNDLKLGRSVEFNAGAYYIQDSAAMMSVELLDVKEEDYVLDMCASPGGKSFDALVNKVDKGLLICNDINPLRANIISSNIEKYGFSNVIVLNDNSNNYKSRFINFFDKIILDAPCSGSAMFRKNEDAIKLWSIEKVVECSKIQKQLLEDAYEMLKEKGRIVYSTCSFSKEENEDVIKSFLDNHDDMSIINIDLNKSFNDTINVKGGLRLYPHKFDGEGQVIFILEKQSSTGLNSIKELKPSKVVNVVKSFLNDIKFEYDEKDIISINGTFYYCNFKKVNLEKLHVLRYGLELGKIVNDRFEPSHALAMYHKLDTSNYIDLTLTDAIDYFAGYTISKEGSSSYKVVRYNNLALGWVKHNNNMLKNHLPKGLRVKILL